MSIFLITGYTAALEAVRYFDGEACEGCCIMTVRLGTLPLSRGPRPLQG